MATEKRLIDANRLKDIIQEVISEAEREDLYTKNLTQFGYVLDSCPTVEAVEVKHGHWRYYSTTMQECSNCQRHTARHKFKYCPHCGAVMEDRYNDG